MAKIIVTAQVNDLDEWEAGFRTHGSLFRDLGISSPVHFGTAGNNEVGIYEEVADLDKMMESLTSPQVIEAMEHDGVRRETVKVIVLDKELSF